jgi:hypothetical protein
MPGDQTTEVSRTSQQAQEVSELIHQAKSTNGAFTRCLPKDLKQALDGVQRLVCLLLAVWVMYRYNNLWEFIAILAVSQIDPRGAKDILVRVLKSLVSEGK